MKTQSLMWAVLPGLVSFANAKKIRTETKCVVVNGQALCPGETLEVDQFVTIQAGFPPNSKKIAKWQPKWEQTVFLPTGVALNNDPVDNVVVGSDECVYGSVFLNPYYFIACLNDRYVGVDVANPWAVKNFGTDGPPDYTDPNHFVQGGNSWDATERNNDIYDPEHKLPSNDAEDNAFEPFRSLIINTGGINPKNPQFDNQAPPLTYPPKKLQNGGRTYQKSDKSDKSEADGSTQHASADPDHSLFDTPVAAGVPPLDGIFAGDAGTDIATTLDPSIFDNAGKTFDPTSQADLSAFDSSTNIASGDWDSSLASTGVDLFTADNNNGGDPTAGNLAFLDGADGSTDYSLFSKRSRKSPRDFRP